MAFTIEHFQDLIRLLEEHPEWRAELRRHVLSEEFLELPGIVRQLAEAQERTERRLAELAEAQERTERRLAELAEAQERTERRVAELAEAQERTERQVDKLEAAVTKLAEAQERTERRLAELVKTQEHMERRLAKVERGLADLRSDFVGDRLERRYRERAYAYFGSLLRRIEVLTGAEAFERLEERLTPQGAQQVALADVIVKGVPREAPQRGEVWLVLEVSSTVDRDDVRRAIDRAQVVRKAGIRALPAVAGEKATKGALELTQTAQVLFLQDGRAVTDWGEALEAWAGDSAPS